MQEPKELLSKLFQEHFNTPIDTIAPLAPSGSYRQYYRIHSDNKSVLGVYNADLQENKAYLSFTKTFAAVKISVPEVYIVSKDQRYYLIEDLGLASLWDCAQQDRAENGELSKKCIDLYKLTLNELLDIQTKTIDKLDLSFCYPRDAFDKQSILWDLNYFKYFFLRLMRVSVDEQKLEDDIQKLAKKLDKVDQNFFLYRDFQSRNVMINKGVPFFIDFQGGRKGSFYYDVASLLYDANVKLTECNRKELLSFYYKQLIKKHPIERTTFDEKFTLFSVVRLTQALGAFGLRGVIEKKPHFKECIPYALQSLKDIIDTTEIKDHYPTLSIALLNANSSTYITEIVAEH
jgi:aminoglycoside/choline kinase family phosphotransferase